MSYIWSSYHPCPRYMFETGSRSPLVQSRSPLGHMNYFLLDPPRKCHHIYSSHVIRSDFSKSWICSTIHLAWLYDRPLTHIINVYQSVTFRSFWINVFQMVYHGSNLTPVQTAHITSRTIPGISISGIGWSIGSPVLIPLQCRKKPRSLARYIWRTSTLLQFDAWAPPEQP